MLPDDLPSTDPASEWIPTEPGATGLPAPSQTAAMVMPDGAVIVARRFGRPRGPRVVFSHGNGIAVDAYYPFWRRFVDDFDVVVFDLRNHGWNPVGELKRHYVPSMVWDLEYIWHGLARHFGPKPALGVFHSLSALAALYHALRVGRRWSALMLFEPPVMPPPGHPMERVYWARRSQVFDAASSRRPRFERYEDFADLLRRSSTMSRLVPSGYALYARATLRPSPQGGFELRCPREYEARIFGEAMDSTLGLAARSLNGPLLVVGGDPCEPHPMPPTRICSALFPEWGIDFETVPHTSHFVPLEAPGACHRAAMAFFERTGVLG